MVFFKNSIKYFLYFFSGFKGIPVPDFVDGQSFIKDIDGDTVLSSDYSNRQILIEYWGEGDSTTYNPQCDWHKRDRLSVSILHHKTNKNQVFHFLSIR